jgi:nucleotide-binding universal stress UspA family protein
VNDPLLVFGDDGSAHADRAWLWICNQRWPGWHVEVVTSDSDPRDVWTDELPLHLDPWTPSSPRRAFAETGIAEVRHLHCDADARLALGARTDASLIVVGPKGRHSLKTLFLGSTADHLLRHAPAPVLVATTSTPARTVLVAVDGSACAHHAVEVLAGLPLAGDAERIIVIGVSPPENGEDRTPAIEAGIERARAALAPFPTEPLLVRDAVNPAEPIVEQARSSRVDLVVAGTRGVSGLRRLLVGSTANALAQASPSAILFVPPDEGAAIG